ncbi:hypothetical protein GQ457_03G004050 [Hibiscus cannabinus]
MHDRGMLLVVAHQTEPENLRGHCNPSFPPHPNQTTVWTNEKHNSYLDNLEASFVKQLHSSVSSHGCHPRKEMWEPCATWQLPAKGHSYSRQFSVLQDGCSQKIKYQSNDPLCDSTADSCDIVGSPWLHHFKYTGKSSSETFPVPRETVVQNDGIYMRSNNTNFFCKSAGSSEKHPIYQSNNHNLGSCIAEVSDQNFVDEDQGRQTGRVSWAKRLKTKALVYLHPKHCHYSPNVNSILIQGGCLEFRAKPKSVSGELWGICIDTEVINPRLRVKIEIKIRAHNAFHGKIEEVTKLSIEDKKIWKGKNE